MSSKAGHGGRGVLHAIGNAHIDPVWLWRWNEGLEAIRATVRSALDRISEYPDFVFTASSAAFYEQLAQVDPEMMEEVRRRVREGRFEIAGGWWVEPDVNIPCGESLVRQALYGQHWFERYAGVSARVGYNPDTFGHPRTLPQILKGAGLGCYSFLRPMPDEKQLPENVFWWVAPDGSRVLCSRITRAYCTWFDEMDEHVRLNDEARPRCVRDYTVFYGVGNHGGGPTIANIESLRRIAEDPESPDVRLSSLRDYFASLLADIDAGAEVPVVTDDLQHHARGCYTAHSGIKRLNRRAEHLLMDSERLCCAAAMAAGRDYPADALGEAWKSLLYNQFHDILAGTSLREACEDACEQYGHTLTVASRELHFAAQSIARRVDTQGEGAAILVFNPLPWAVRAPVEIEPAAGRTVVDDRGAAVPSQRVQTSSSVGFQQRLVFTADLPPCGYSLMRFASTESSCVTSEGGTLEAGDNWLQNQFLRVEVDRASGLISQLTDLRTGAKLLSEPGHALAVIDDPDDTWSHGVPAFRSEVGRFGDARVCLEEHGPVRAVLRVESHWKTSRALQRLILYAGLDYVECRVTVDWHEPRKVVKLCYPLALQCPEVACEIPYGFTLWPADGEEHPCQKWVDVSGASPAGRAGFALLNDCKHGFDCLESELRMTLLRSPAYAHHDPEKLSPGRAYRYIDIGEQDIVLRLVPHAGDWREAGIPRRAWELNAQPFYVNEYSHAGDLPSRLSFASCDHPGVIISVLKQAEDGDGVIVRAYETHGRAVRSMRLQLPALGAEWAADFRGSEIRSWRVRGSGPAEIIPVDLLERPV